MTTDAASQRTLEVVLPTTEASDRDSRLHSSVKGCSALVSFVYIDILLVYL